MSLLQLKVPIKIRSQLLGKLKYQVVHKFLKNLSDFRYIDQLHINYGLCLEQDPLKRQIRERVR